MLQARSVAIVLTLSLSGLATGTTQSPEAVHHLWGGENRQAFSRSVDTGQVVEHHTWVVGDGAFVRHTVDVGQGHVWEFQDTPADATQALLDVYFLEDGLTGWACGTGGLLLHTPDGGATWSLLPRVCLPDCGGGRATLWRVRFVDPLHGYLTGLWCFLRTTDGGQTWSTVQLQIPAGSPFSASTLTRSYEFYALDIVQDGGDWIGVCAGQEWGGHCPSIFTSLNDALETVVFHTDSLDTGGVVWNAVFSEAYHNATVLSEPVTIHDAWDVEFEPAPADYRSAVGYLAGGTANASGSVLRTADSGLTWSYEAGGPSQPMNTLYGVAALSADAAVACGYGGDIWYRSGAGTWVRKKAGTFSGPLTGVHAARFTNQDHNCLVVGSWDFLRSGKVVRSQGAPPTWSAHDADAPRNRKELFRFNELSFLSATDGFAVGQHDLIATTVDGGASWPLGRVLNGGPPGGPGSRTLKGIAFDGAGVLGVAVGAQGTVYLLEDTTGTGSVSQGNWVVSVPSIPLPVSFELEAVAWSGAAQFWAVGEDTAAARPLVLRSEDGGRSWVDLTHAALAGGVVLVDVAFLNGTEGFAVGYTPGTENTNEPDRPAAYRLTYSSGPGTLVATDVLPGALFSNGDCPFPLTCPVGRLHAVATRGRDLATAEVYIAGGPNVLARWETPAGGTPGFYAVRGIPACPDACPLTPTPGPACALDFRSLALAPGGTTILAGLEGLPHEHVAHELGRLLRDEGNGWEWIRGRSSKDILSIFLLDDDTGWLLRGGDNRGSVPAHIDVDLWERDDLDTEFGSVGDTGVLSYDPR